MRTEETPLDSYVRVSADELTKYVAEAPPGTSQSLAMWRVCKIVKSAATAPYTITTTYAPGSLQGDTMFGFLPTITW